MSNHRDPVPEWLNKNYLEELLQKSLNDKDLKVNDVQITPGSNEGDNYCCQVFRIVCNISNGENVSETVSLIGKLKPATAVLGELEKIVDLFNIEAQFFSLLQPKLNRVLKEIPQAKEYTPKCYHVDLERNIIFMEDLKVKKFELQERGKFLNLHQAEKVMEALGTFHGASLHVLNEAPELKKTFHKYIWGKELNSVMLKLIKNATDSLKKHAENYGLPENHCKKLFKTQEECEDGHMEIVDLKDGKINVLCHGDSWMNNMMFRFQDGIPDDITLLDFQIINYNSFANDLHYFLFSSVSADVITTKLDYLLEKYYLKLREISPKDMDLSLERIKSEFAERYYFGYIMTVMFRPYIVAETPVDLDDVLFDKGVQDSGFINPIYINDLKLLLPLFENVGLIE